MRLLLFQNARAFKLDNRTVLGFATEKRKNSFAIVAGKAANAQLSEKRVRHRKTEPARQIPFSWLAFFDGGHAFLFQQGEKFAATVDVFLK